MIWSLGSGTTFGAVDRSSINRSGLPRIALLRIYESASATATRWARMVATKSSMETPCSPAKNSIRLRTESGMEMFRVLMQMKEYAEYASPVDSGIGQGSFGNGTTSKPACHLGRMNGRMKAIPVNGRSIMQKIARSHDRNPEARVQSANGAAAASTPRAILWKIGRRGNGSIDLTTQAQRTRGGSPAAHGSATYLRRRIIAAGSWRVSMTPETMTPRGSTV